MIKCDVIKPYINYYSTGIKSKEYYINGKYHNEHGPAIIWYRKDGSTEREGYWLNGEELSYDKWMIATAKSDEEKMIRKLQYG